MIDQFKLIYYYYYDFYYYYGTTQGARGCMWVCMGVLRCRQAYVDVRGYARVCAGMRRGVQCGQVCASVHWCAQVCRSVWVSASVCV